MKQKETKLKERILEELSEFPRTWVCKVQQVAKRGTPDILASISGVFVAIELKTDTGRLSKLQSYNLEQIAKTGAIAVVLTPKFKEKYMCMLRDLADRGAETINKPAGVFKCSKK